MIHEVLKKVSIILMLVSTLIIGCSRKSDVQFAYISVNTEDKNDTVFSILGLDLLTLKEVILSDAKISPLGQSTIRLKLSKPRFAWLKLNDYVHPLFLIPGSKVEVSLKNSENLEEVSFAGNGSIANGYLAYTHTVLYDLRENIWSENPERFATILDSMSSVLDLFHSNYVDSTSLNPDISALMKKHRELSLLNIWQIYEMSHADVVKNNSRWKFIEPLFDMTYLDFKMSEYAMALDFYLQSKIYPPLWEKSNNKVASHTRDELPLISAEMIKRKDLPKEIKEFLIAKNIDYWLTMEGITPEIDSMYYDFKIKFEESEYMATLENEYKSWLDIGSGSPAPVFSTNDTKGNPFLLESQIGKVVYIDLWATWCGPCIQEFSYYGKLMEGIAEKRDSITFLFVSVDEDKDKWLDFLERKNLPNGIHVIENPTGQHAPIRESYKIWNIPRYVIIDKEGKIVDVNAPKPSSVEILEILHNAIDG